MIKRVLVIGGYGNFGQFISRRLARESDIQVIVAGRDIIRAQAFVEKLESCNAPFAVLLDIHKNLAAVLREQQPCVVIHTSGPFQAQGYDVARACILAGCHYIDLADGREFVNGIDKLDAEAKAGNVLVCSGASSVPTLTSAIIDHYLNEFSCLLNVEYAISTAQKSGRGLATTESVLSYAGKPFKTLVDGKLQPVFGWLDLRNVEFFGLGRRLLGNCDVPDLDLFPCRYESLQSIHFQAGLELKVVHGSLVVLSWLVRVGVLRSLQPHAALLLKISNLFDCLGTENSGFYMELSGKDQGGVEHKLRFDLVARKGEGVYIPCVPSILMAMKLARGEVTKTGAYPCMGFISFEDYLGMLGEFAVEWRECRPTELSKG